MIDTDPWTDATSVWVFGYGSLIWKPGFRYETKEIGYIEGFERRFWQGSVSHRGTVDSPGRVATLTEKPKGKVWGVAYHVVGEEQISEAMEHLSVRECLLGGYSTYVVPFHVKDCNKMMKVVLYAATPNNQLYLGETAEENIAAQVVASEGHAGYNVEYVVRITDFMRHVLPEEKDSHLYSVDYHIRRILKEQEKSILMDELTFNIVNKSEIKLSPMREDSLGNLYEDVTVDEIDDEMDESGVDCTSISFIIDSDNEDEDDDSLLNCDIIKTRPVDVIFGDIDSDNVAVSYSDCDTLTPVTLTRSQKRAQDAHQG